VQGDDLLYPTGFADPTEEGFDPVSAQIRAAYISRAMLNGQEWAELNEGEKANYLLGYVDGVMNTVTYHLRAEPDRKAAVASLPTSAGDLPTGKLVLLVDQFYADEQNLGIPISFALEVIRNRRSMTGEGWTPEFERRVGEYIKSLREMFSEAPGT